MATFDYSEFYDLAVELLTEFGADVDVESRTNTGSQIEPIWTTATAPAKAVVFDIITTDQMRRSGDVAESLIPVTGQLILISPAITTEVRKGHVVVYSDGSRYRINEREKLAPAPGGLVVLYQAMVETV